MTLTSTITQKGQVTIPLFIRQALGFWPKMKVVFVKRQDRLYIKPAVNFLDLAGSINSKKPFDILMARKAAKKLVSQRYAQSY